MAEKLETGVETLDRKLNGGLPKGSITVLEASPGSQGHLILHELTAARGTMWMSFARTEEAIKKTLAESPAPTGDCTVKYMSGETPIDDVGKFLAAVPPESNIILDPVDVLESETEPRDYRGFLNELQSHLLSHDSLAMLFGTHGESRPGLRDTTKYFADVVFELDTTYDKEDVENYLRVPKYRRGECPAGVIKLELKSNVSIDISRDIA